MAILYIAEYERLARDDEGNILPVPEEPAIATQAVTFSTATASAAFNKNTRFVMLSADAEAHIKFGTTPVATTSHPQLFADTERFLGVKVALVTGDGAKVSAVAAA